MSDIASFPEYVAQYTNSRQFLTLGSSNGLTDQTGNARDGIAAGGVTVGGAVGPGDLGATQFDGVDDAVTTTYNPFSNGEIKSFFGWAYRDSSAAVHTLFSSDAGGNRPVLQLMAAAPASVQFFPDRGLAATTWTTAWPGNSAWYFWALVHNAPTTSAELWIGTAAAPPTSQGVKTGLTAFNAAPGNIQYGSGSTNLQPFAGRQAMVGVIRGDISADLQTFWSWGLSTDASRSPSTGLPSASNFPYAANLPRGESWGTP